MTVLNPVSELSKYSAKDNVNFEHNYLCLYHVSFSVSRGWILETNLKERRFKAKMLE